MIEIAIVGCGQRGKDVYGELLKKDFSDKVKVKGIAEPKEKSRKYMKDYHNIDEEFVFLGWKELLEHEKFCDAIIISTNDDMHYEPFKKALEKGYHIIVEKPMTNDRKELSKMEELAQEYSDKIISVGHVLRYSPFFNKIKDIIDSGELGKLVSIQHAENIGYYHMGHSFVRGNWRNSIETSPIILAKSCHDMDILLYLTGSSCTKVSSFGSLSYFNKENKPMDAGYRCLECDIENECPYSAKKLYLNNIGNWPSTVITINQTKEGIIKALNDTDYGLCVHESDNDVMDNQVSILEFNNGVTATFSLTAFTHTISRTIKIMGSHGEIIGDMETNKLIVYDFVSGEKKSVDIKLDKFSLQGHGGGDARLVKDFIELVEKKMKTIEVVKNKIKLEENKELEFKDLVDIVGGKDNSIESQTSIKTSIESHKMAFAVDEARIYGKVVNLENFIL